MSELRHGTTTGYRAHQAAGQRPCDACVAAKAAYDKRWRATPAARRYARLHARAQNRAATWLRREFPAEWRVLYEKALVEVYAEVGEAPPAARTRAGERS